MLINTNTQQRDHGHSFNMVRFDTKLWPSEKLVNTSWTLCHTQTNDTQDLYILTGNQHQRCWAQLLDTVTHISPDSSFSKSQWHFKNASSFPLDKYQVWTPPPPPPPPLQQKHHHHPTNTYINPKESCTYKQTKSASHTWWLQLTKQKQTKKGGGGGGGGGEDLLLWHDFCCS